MFLVLISHSAAQSQQRPFTSPRPAPQLAGLKALAASPQVESIERHQHPHPSLNKSVPDIKANQVWALSGDNFSGYTGRGVIVGIIDTGIDITHNNFRKSDGTTRIVAIWDQTLTTQSGETAPGPITDPNLTLGGTHPTDRSGSRRARRAFSAARNFRNCSSGMPRRSGV
jgi:subtilisin family serine protease